MTLKDEILEFTVEVSRELEMDSYIANPFTLSATVERVLNNELSLTQLTVSDVSVNKEVVIDTSVERLFEWELEL